MYEGDEESIDYRSATLKDAILALDNRGLIDEIDKLAKKTNCRISLCHPRKVSETDEIHFSLELIDNEIPTTVFDKAEISTHIADTIQYDKVRVNFKRCDQQTFERLYDAATPFTPENYNNIREFFQKHYRGFYTELSKDVDVAVHQDKRRRSVSPPCSSLFSQNGNYQREVDNLPPPEVVAEFLKTAIKKAPFWPALSTSPEKIGESFDRAKRALTQEQTVVTKPVDAAKM